MAGYLGIDLRLSPLYKILHIKNSANPGTVFWYSISIHLPLSDRITGIQLIISALLGDEFIVVAALDDAALFQNHDAVTVLDSRKSVGDDESGSSFHQLIHAVLYNFLGTGIDRAGSLIQDQYRRIRYGCSGNRKQLSLTLA